MATYVYETLSDDPARPRRRFEVQQSMKDDPLTKDPETGEPVRRVITGGYGFVAASKGSGGALESVQSHGAGGCGHAGCGCGHGH